MEQTITTGVIYYHEPPNREYKNPGEPDRINPCFQPQFLLPFYE